MLTSFIYNFSLPFHEFCLQASPTSPWQPLYQALVCGANLSGDFTEALRRTSLLHVAIVSGSHLVLLEVLLHKVIPEKIRPLKLTLALLFIFCLLTGWQAPAVRSFVTLCLQRWNHQKRLHWTGPQMTFFSGIFTWILFPQWFFSYSFLLSWGASLSLCLVPDSIHLRFLQQWKTHLFVYVLLLPLLLPFGGVHPLSILCNWLIGPLFSALFFPLSLIAFLCPWVTPITDFIWQLAVYIITEISHWIPAPELDLQAPITLLWFYLFALHLIFHFLHIHRKRDHGF